jgi:hypothetical protein
VGRAGKEGRCALLHAVPAAEVTAYCCRSDSASALGTFIRTLRAYSLRAPQCMLRQGDDGNNRLLVDFTTLGKTVKSIVPPLL